MGASAEELFDAIAALRAEGAAFCVATVVRTAHATAAKAGAKAVVKADGTVLGHVGGGCVQGALRRAAAEVLASGRPKLIRVRPREEMAGDGDAEGLEQHDSQCPSGGTTDLFLEPMGTAPRLLVCGETPVAHALAALAPQLGYRTAIATGAEDLAGRATALGLGPRDHLVVASQGRGDRAALAAALDLPCAYLAFVGSRRKAEVLKAALREQGVPDEALARLRAPAGLDLNAIEPEEIALSILAEIVQLRRRGQRDGGAC